MPQEIRLTDCRYPRTEFRINCNSHRDVDSVGCRHRCNSVRGRRESVYGVDAVHVQYSMSKWTRRLVAISELRLAQQPYANDLRDLTGGGEMYGRDIVN